MATHLKLSGRRLQLDEALERTRLCAVRGLPGVAGWKQCERAIDRVTARFPGGSYRLLPPAPDQRPRASAVLLPLYAREGEPYLLFIKRSDRVAWHKGEIAFPGGRIEDSDASPLDAALRETEEELGIPRRDIVPLSALDPVATVVSGMLIYPHVGRLHAPPSVHPDGFEVAEVIEAPLWHLLNPSSRLIADRVVSGGTRRLPFYKFGQHEIWGATGRILESLIARLSDHGADQHGKNWSLDQIAAILAGATPSR